MHCQNVLRHNTIDTFCSISTLIIDFLRIVIYGNPELFFLSNQTWPQLAGVGAGRIVVVEIL